MLEVLALIEAARCPNDCVQGLLIDEYAIDPCPWCAEREALKAALKECE
jgi:hypothetical protein